MTASPIRRSLIAAAAVAALVGCGGSPPTSGAQPQVAETAPPPPTATSTEQPTGTATAPPPSKTSAPPTATPIATALPDYLSRCADVASESHYCLALTYGVAALLGLDSGAVCPVVATGASFGVIDTNSIAWIDDAFYACDEARLYRVSLRDGSWSAVDLPCLAVTAYRGGLLIADAEGWGKTLHWYADFAAVAAGQVGADYAAVDFTSRFTTRADTLFAAWHSTDTIERKDLASGDLLEPIHLEEYDDWILGLSVTDDDYLVVSGPDWGWVVVLFDAVTGTQLRRLHPFLPLGALACVTNVAATPVLPTRPPTHTPTPSPTPCDGDNCPTPTFSPAPCLGSWGRTPRLGRVADFPPSLPVESCTNGGTSSNYIRDDAPATGPELHVVAVNEGVPDSDFLNYQRGRVRVTVEARPRPVVLALSAYNPVEWDLTVQPGAILERIVVQGYYAPILTGVPAGVPVQQIGPGCTRSYGWEVSALSSDSDFRDFIADMRAVTGLTETSFQGCYAGDRFEVPHWLDFPPNERPTPVAGDESLPRAQVAFPECGAVTAESVYCLTTTESALALIGLDSGAICPLPLARPLSLGWSTSSIAWRGDIAYVCAYGQGLVRIRVTDGAWELAQVPCEAVTDYDNGLLVLAPYYWPTQTRLAAFATYDDVLAGQPLRQYALGGDFDGMTARGQRLYGARFATDALVVADLDSGATLPPLPLERDVAWVDGLAVLGDGRLLLAGGTPERLLAFDVATGAQLPDPVLDGHFGGLACVERGAAP